LSRTIDKVAVDTTVLAKNSLDDVIACSHRMTCSGIAVGADYADIIIVDAEPNQDKMTLLVSRKLQLQDGNKAKSFRALGDQLANILRESKVVELFIKKSAAGRHVGLSHLEAAEMRGMVLYLASSITQVTAINPTVLSKTFGKRKPKEYLKDDAYWNDRNLAVLEKQYRDPCLLIIAGLDR
jgi:hypothetical protein